MALQMSRAALAWSMAGLLAALFLPWYGLDDGVGAGVWLSGLWSSEDHAGGVAQVLVLGRWWLAPALMALVGCLAVSAMPMASCRRGTWLAIASASGVVLTRHA